MIIRLQSLEFENIGRFTSLQKIDFSNRKHLIQVDGRRLDYNGSSGAGKSTIFQANDFVLGLNTTPATVLQSRKTKNALWAKGHYLVGDENFPISIERGKKDGLIIEGISPFTKEPVKISGNNAVAEEFIDSIIGIPREVFKLMTHKRQKDRGFFISMTPSLSYEFMVKSLGLATWLDKIEKSEVDLKNTTDALSKTEVELNTLTTVLLMATKELGTAKELLDSIPAFIPGAENLSILKNEVSDLEKLIQIEESAQKERLLTVPTPALIDSNIPADPEIATSLAMKQVLQGKAQAEQAEAREKLSILLKEESTLATAIADMLRKINKEDQLKKEITSLVADIKHLKDGKCMTCHQGWQNDNSKAKIDELQLKLNDLVKEYKTIPEFKGKKAVLESEKEGLKTQIEEAKQSKPSIFASEIENLDKKVSILQQQHSVMVREIMIANQTALAEVEKQKEIIRNDFAVNISALKSGLQLKKSTLTQLELDIAVSKTKHSAAETAVATANKKWTDIDVKMQECRNNMLTLQEKRDIIDSAKQAMKSFTMESLEGALSEIGEEATRRLSQISNMSTTTVYFDSFKEKKGKVKEEITPFVSIDGDEGVPVRSLSGGEDSAINLAIDLAVVEVIERRGAVGADYFVMDEPFEGLDTQCRQDCIELLKNSSLAKRIILVDHTEQVKEMVDDRIVVVRGTDESYIEA